MMDLTHTQRILHKRFKSRVSMRNILELQKAIVGIVAVSAARGGYRSGKLYHRRPRNTQGKLSDKTYETTEPQNPIPFAHSSKQLGTRHDVSTAKHYSTNFEWKFGGRERITRRKSQEAVIT